MDTVWQSLCTLQDRSHRTDSFNREPNMLQRREYQPCCNLGSFYKSRIRVSNHSFNQSLSSLLGRNHILLGYASEDGDMLVFVDTILQTLNCYELTLGLQVKLATHRLVWSLQMFINNDIVVLVLFKEINNEDEDDEARNIDIPCEIIAYSIAQQLTTVCQDYHTKSIDNHHLLPIKIHIATNTYTGSLAVTHSNQFIKFYYYGGGYAEIQDYYHIHSLNNYISEKKLFIPSPTNNCGHNTGNWYNTNCIKPNIIVSTFDLSVFTNVFISYFYPNNKFRISGYECRYVSLCDNNLDVILVLSVTLSAAKADSVARVVTATLLFSPFYGTVVALKFIDLNEFTRSNGARCQRYLLDTILLPTRDLAGARSTLHAAYATAFYAKLMTTDKNVGRKLTNIPSLDNGSCQRIEHPWLPHSICL